MGHLAVIVLDTHIWIWWVHGDSKLSQTALQAIQQNEQIGIGISAISCWEIAKLVEYNRLTLPCTINDWFTQALDYPSVRLLELTPKIAIESTQLSGFHKDPADQIIVATARIFNCPLVTSDSKIIAYPNVQTIS